MKHCNDKKLFNAIYLKQHFMDVNLKCKVRSGPEAKPKSSTLNRSQMSWKPKTQFLGLNFLQKRVFCIVCCCKNAKS